MHGTDMGGQTQEITGTRTFYLKLLAPDTTGIILKLIYLFIIYCPTINWRITL